MEWSAQDLQELARLRAAGASLDEIAQALGRTRLAVKRKATELHIRSPSSDRPWTDQDDALIVALRRQGVTIAGIGARLGRTTRAVSHRMVDRLSITFYCCQCQLDKRSNEYASMRQHDGSICRQCVDAAPAGRYQRDQAVSKGQYRHPVVDVLTERERQVRRFSDQFEKTPGDEGRRGPNARWSPRTYVLPSEQDWVQRFTTHPETMGRVLRDVVLEAWWADHPEPGRIGRRPDIELTAADLIQYLPERIWRELLPQEWGHHDADGE